MVRRPKLTFLPEDIQMVKRDTKRCSKSLITREMRIKTTIRYYLTLVRMPRIKGSTSDKRWRGVEKRDLPGAMETDAAPTVNTMKLP